MFLKRFTYGLSISALILLSTLLFGAVFISVFSYFHVRGYIGWQVKDHLIAVTTVGAELFTGEELDRIRGPEDADSPVYRSTVEKLKSIMDADTNIYSVYLMRRTDDPMTLSFIADAEALLSFEEQDVNGDGVLDETERIPLPGELYDVSEVPMMQQQAFLRTVTDESFTEDQWGRYISGYAPVYRSDGSVAGIIGIDILDTQISALSQRLFPITILILLVFFGLMVFSYTLFVIVERYKSFHRQLESERDSILQLVLHELGEPVTMLNWSLETLENEQKTKNILFREQLENMRSAVTWLQRIYSTLLRVDRTAKRPVDQRKPAPMRSVLEHVRGDLKESLAKRKQHLHVSMEGNPIVTLGTELLSGVLRELISNASDFSPEGSTIRVVVKPKNHRWICIEIIDEGCGIPKSDRTRIFERFARGSNANIYKPVGTGMGLYVARKIVQRAGGKINVKSEEGEGTTVTVLVPKV